MDELRLESLAAIPLFAELDRAGLERVAALATEVEFPRGSVLIERNQPGSGLFLILDGTATVELRRRRVELGPGEFVGELSLLTPDGRRHARVVAGSDLRCLAISRTDFTRLLESEPRIATAMLATVARRLADSTDAGSA